MFKIEFMSILIGINKIIYNYIIIETFRNANREVLEPKRLVHMGQHEVRVINCITYTVEEYFFGSVCID